MNVLDGFELVDSSCYSKFKLFYQQIIEAEFYHGITQMINDKFYYRIFDNKILVVIKPTAIMGNYSLLCYSTPLTIGDVELDKIIDDLLHSGIGFKTTRDNCLRLFANDNFVKDPYGGEYIYDSDEWLKMEGGKYKRHRCEIRRFEEDERFEVAYEYNKDVDKVVSLWSKAKGVKHQIKLLKTIRDNISFLSIKVLYYDSEPYGFTVTERINDRNTIILQRLISPIENRSNVIELNYILHHLDCVDNRGRMLNICGDVNIRNMEVAKKKLRPIEIRKMVRVKSKIKTTKELYRRLKNQKTGN